MSAPTRESSSGGDVGQGLSSMIPAGGSGHRRRGPFRQLLQDRRTLTYAIILGVIVVAAIIGPYISPWSRESQDLLNRNISPTGAHWLGTTNLGSDLLTQSLYGTRTTLIAAVQAVVVAALLGVPTGLLAGYMRGPVDGILNLFSDVLLSIPGLVLALAIIGIRGPGLTNAMIAVGVIFAPRFYRLSRGMAQALREESYVDAARSMGFTQRRILWRHVLPNALPALIVQVTFTFGFAVVAEAGLSFLGLGVQVPDTSLGLLVRDGFTQVRVNSFPFFPPAVLVTVIVFVFASLGDALQDSLGLGGDRASR